MEKVKKVVEDEKSNCRAVIGGDVGAASGCKAARHVGIRHPGIKATGGPRMASGQGPPIGRSPGRLKYTRDNRRPQTDLASETPPTMPSRFSAVRLMNKHQKAVSPEATERPTAACGEKLLPTLSTPPRIQTALLSRSLPRLPSDHRSLYPITVHSHQHAACQRRIPE